VIRRHPDIPLLRRADDIDAVAGQQRQLLSALWRTLAAGGRLLYVTCSVLPEENESVVGDFLRLQADAEERSVLPDYNIRDVMRRRACGYQILPGDRDLDGFFYACLGKRA
jgi:16S rRNA (cytosine967-C5)-methyltransferase